PGDVLVMTAAVESLHRAHPGQFLTEVESTCPAVWEHNPLARPLTPALRPHVRRVEMHYPLIERSNQFPVHFLQGYCDFLADQLGVP
ncbi:hypothetical protein, partial [Salmonella sp. SAL4447]|uniref:hypothetical protein n=1 Tax=Salmonella sp. SAL4447 TaxID=3159902 RepID=UPI0039793500